MRETMERATETGYPVDDGTYNLMVTLTEKLQAIESYRMYSEDVGGQEQELYRQLIDEDTRHAQQIFEVLKQRISGG
jgi:hypothetical protein